MVFGMFKITYDARYVSDDRISNFISSGRTISLKGTISDLPRITGQSIRFVIEAEELEFNETNQIVSGGVLVSLYYSKLNSALAESLTYGREVMVRGELVPAGTARNPGEFDLRKYLQLNNIYARLYVEKSDTILLGEEARHNFLTLYVYPVRRSVGERLDRLIGGEEAKFLKGLIIGERSEIPMDVKLAFINSGVMHILAVSGLHVAIVALILLVLFQMIRIPEKPRIIITCVLLVYYIFLTGAAASVARSVVMAIVFLCAKLIERRTDVYNTLALSAIVLLLIDSKQLFQPGFQLSFAAVFSLVYLYPKFYALKDFLPDWLKSNRLIVGLIAAISVSLAAGIGTLPFTSIYFGKISIISFVANIVIVPLSNVILALGMLTVAVSYASSWIAMIYAEATSFLTWLLLRLVGFFGNLRLSYVDSHFTIVTSLLFYIVVGIVVNLEKKEMRKISIIIGLVTANIMVYGWILFAPTKTALTATFIDIGQGDAIFLEFPDGQNLLVDAGPKTVSSDAGERFIAPFLLRQGIHRLNGILVSHPHSDHLGGVPYLLRHFEVDQVIDAGSFGNSELYREYLHLIDSLKIARRILQAGTMLRGFNDIRLYILHPSGSFIPADSMQRVNFNNQSLVVKLVYGETSLLLAGDAEKEAENRIVNVYHDFLQSSVLKAGHHGSITSTSPEFFAMVRPRMAVISVGLKNKFHHPSPVVIDRLKQADCLTFRTDELGAIILLSDGKRWLYSDWH
jgi:competence protein ComEC